MILKLKFAVPSVPISLTHSASICSVPRAAVMSPNRSPTSNQTNPSRSLSPWSWRRGHSHSHAYHIAFVNQLERARSQDRTDGLRRRRPGLHQVQQQEHEVNSCKRKDKPLRFHVVLPRRVPCSRTVLHSQKTLSCRTLRHKRKGLLFRAALRLKTASGREIRGTRVTTAGDSCTSSP